ncbi:MAG TPA: DUF4838 domain-containing protein [Candidatus Hydrogenedens sp.]|nr:DUF4838 domain-containing protein [Candidatus Hydrogenedens sp.]
MTHIGWIRLGLIFVFIFSPFLLFAQSDDVEMKDWIDASLYRDMNIVIPVNASPILQHSAEVFKKYWELCTYRPISISNTNQGLLNIWLGPELCTQELIHSEELEDLGEEGFIIRTYTPTRKYAQKGVAKQLLICGKTDLGTLHGVYTFFERYLNVAWLSSSYTHTPPLGYRLKEIDYKFSPHFEYRFFLSDLPEFKMDGDRKEGLHLSLSIPEKDLVPIPIYKCLQINEGTSNTKELEVKLSNKGNPVCFTSETIKRTFLNFIKRQIDSYPERKFWMIDTGDIDNVCSCKNCQELVNNTGAIISPLLKMLNDVVEEIEKLYSERDLRFCLSLRNSLRKAPQNMQVHQKIFLALSTDTCDVANSLDNPTSTTNACFLDDLKAWSNITPNILIQYYVGANYYCGLFHQAELFNFQKNIQLFDHYQVRGIIICTPSQKVFPFTEFGALKSYILARLIWDPDLIIEEEINRFLSIYYGSAGTKFAEFLNYQKEFVKKNNVRCSIYQRVPWWNADYTTFAEKIIQQTMNMTFYSEEVYNRVLQTTMPLYYSSLICPPEIQIQEDKIIENRVNTAQKESFWKNIDKIEASLQKGFFVSYREIVPKWICSDTTSNRSSSFRRCSLDNEFYTLWIVPENRGAIIRMQDKSSGIEYLSAFQKGLNPYFLWNEYKDISDFRCGIPFDGKCLLKESESNKITIEKDIGEGVLLQRKITLGDNRDIIFEYTCDNQNTKEEIVSFYIIPRFTLDRDDKMIEIWGNHNQRWERVKQIDLAYQPFAYTLQNIIQEDTTGIGIYFCDKGAFLQLELQQLSEKYLEFFVSYSYYDSYFAPIIKIHLLANAQQTIPFTLNLQTQQQIPTP